MRRSAGFSDAPCPAHGGDAMTIESDETASQATILDASVLADLALLAPNDPTFLESLVGTFLERSEEIRDSLVIAVDSGDTRTIAGLAHQFTSSSAQMGALHASQIARRIADDARVDEDQRSADLGLLCKELIEAMDETFLALRARKATSDGD